VALATDFPRLWRDPNTPDRERKRMIRLLIEDAALLRDRSWARPVYVAVHNRAAEIAFQDWENVLEVPPEKIP
jgi:hypothetical protein